jgi:hypothetical protein
MSDAVPPLREVLDALAEMLGDVERREVGEGLECSRGGHPFAVIAWSSVELRLDGPIAAAARRTPDVTTSARGVEWIQFSPPVVDRYALDRATAWFEAAWRRSAAVPSGRRRPN